MKKSLNFLGLNISSGQSFNGPELSSEFIRKYFQVFKEIGLEFSDKGNINQSDFEKVKIFPQEQLINIDLNAYRKAYFKNIKLLNNKQPLVNWGGDHSVAISTVSAFCNKFPNGKVLWIDAHADINLPEYSQTGNLHGMPLSILLNLENISKNKFPWIRNHLRTEQLIYLGVRDMDPYEKNIIKLLNIECFTPSHIKQNGIENISKKIFQMVRDSPLHISFDIDSISPEYAKATGLLVPDGLLPNELNYLGKTLSAHDCIKSVDVVEINPLIGGVEDSLDTTIIASAFLMNLFKVNEKFSKQGANYDDELGRTNKNIDPAQMESGS